MNILFNDDRLLRLITNLQTLTGIRANILDVNGKDIHLNISDHKSFCRRIGTLPEGRARCEACDARAVAACSGTRSVYSYRCHAGVCETVFPVCEGGVPIAFLVFGQLLDDSPMEQQWETARATLDWYPGDLEELRRDFFRFRQYSRREIEAYTEILKALASYIQLEGMIRTAEHTDMQKLEIYLDAHYMEKLSLQTISRELHIGRTKLCALAKQLSGGETLSRMIAQRRVEAAKAMLLQEDAPISAVAEAVGFSDYNYFTKIFKSFTGMTPTLFRREGRQPAPHRE
ncbi:MAG: PocR ligand-binding domain-containing protein [Oscillospiraceae bacterium]